MFDIQHDSPVPIHEQLTSQLRVHIASGALKAGAALAEYRLFAQELLTNPQVVARAYAELEDEGVLARSQGSGVRNQESGVRGQESSVLTPGAGGMVVTPRGAALCRDRLRESARANLDRAVALGVAWGLGDAEIAQAVERALAASKVQPLSADEILQAMKKPAHESSHRASQGIQDLSRKNRPGFA